MHCLHIETKTTRIMKMTAVGNKKYMLDELDFMG